MAQVTSGEIACSGWLRRVTSLSFRIGKTTKENFDKLQKSNEFSKLSTKLCISRTMIITPRTTTLKMTILCHAIRM